MLEYPVVTPENLRFNYRLAGPASRFAAWLVDLLVLVLLISALGLLAVVGVRIIGNYAFAIYGLLSFLLLVGYWMFFEHWWRGQTPGKRLFGLRVVAEGGLPLTVSHVVLRNLLRWLDQSPALGGVAALGCLLQAQHRRPGDLAAGTLVVRELKLSPPAELFDAELQGRLVALAGALQEEGFELPRLDSDERGFLLELVRRKGNLELGVRRCLFALAANRLRARDPRLSNAKLSDEALVLLSLISAPSEGPG